MEKVILLAEDSADDEMFFKRVLQSTGIINPIIAVRTGDEVIAYLDARGPYADRRQYSFPVVLFLDLVMPGGDGWEVLKWLKLHPHLHPDRTGMLIFVLTGPSQRDRLQEAYRAGASSFLLKPFNKAEMDGLIEMWPEVWMRPSSNSLRPQIAPLGETPAPPQC